MPASRLLILAAFLTLLLAAVGFIVLVATRPLPPPKLTVHLSDLLPREAIGWIVADQPIADTEEMKRAIGQILNYDDAVLRNYSQGFVTISVYVAYWKPGKMPPRLVAAHTPDICWVGAGWKCTARNFAYQVPPFEKSGRRVDSSSNPDFQPQLRAMLPPAQFGVYVLHETVQNVLYWHLHNSKVFNHEKDKRMSILALLSEVCPEYLNRSGEQVFIRVSSNIPVDKFTQTSVFMQVSSALSELFSE